MEQMSEFTHIKKPYRARCIQNTAANREEVLRFMDGYGYTLWHPGKNGDLYLKHEAIEVTTRLRIPFEHWVRVGENNEIKTLTDAEFQLKYQRIAGGE